MLLRLKVLVDFAVNLDVLQATMENDEDLGVDCPVVQVRDVALEHEFEGGQGRNLVFVLAIEALE